MGSGRPYFAVKSARKYTLGKFFTPRLNVKQSTLIGGGEKVWRTVEKKLLGGG